MNPPQTVPPPEAQELYDWLARQLSVAANLDVRSVRPELPLTRYGLDSSDAIELALTIELAVGVDLPPTLFWEYPTLGLLADYLWREHGVRAPAGNRLP